MNLSQSAVRCHPLDSFTVIGSEEIRSRSVSVAWYRSETKIAGRSIVKLEQAPMSVSSGDISNLLHLLQLDCCYFDGMVLLNFWVSSKLYKFGRRLGHLDFTIAICFSFYKTVSLCTSLPYNNWHQDECLTPTSVKHVSFTSLSHILPLDI